jgi:hypothetical protein
MRSASIQELIIYTPSRQSRRYTKLVSKLGVSSGAHCKYPGASASETSDQQLNPSPKSNTDTAKFKAERLHRFCHTVEGSQLQKIQATRTYLYALTFPSLCISISFLSVPHSVTAYPSVSSLYTFSPSP